MGVFESAESLRGSQRVEDDEELAPGTLAGNYIIESTIGVGGGGIVYAARHQVLGRRAAVKVLRRHLSQSPRMMARFVREAKAVHVIGHPSIVDVYEFDELHDGRPFYVMELIEGPDLRRLLHEHGRFSPSEAFDLLKPISEALAAAHEAGILHRDLKVSNVLVVEKDGKRAAKLVDFGVAKLLHPEPEDASLTTPGSLLGSVHGMSPEQILCEVLDERSDIYSLGVLLFQLLTGRFPYQGKPEDVVGMHLNAPRPRPSEHAPIPPALDAVVARCMDREKERRYPSVAAFLEDLRRAVHGDVSAGDVPAASSAAIGLYVEMRTDADAMDDALLDDMSNVLDTCQERLLTENFLLPVQNPDAVLGVKLLSPSAEEQRVARENAVALATQLLEELATRPLRDPRINISIGLHIDLVVFREAGGDVEVLGGPILDVESWASQRDEGISTSDAFNTAH